MSPTPEPATGAFSPASLVAGIGAATWDRFMLLPEFPQAEGVTPASAAIEQGGGPVATALCTLSSLGWETCLIDSQGNDPVGRTILQDLQRWRVDTSCIKIHPGHASAMAQVLVRERDGSRHIIYHPASCPEPVIDEPRRKIIERAALLHLNGRHEAAARQAVRLAREAGVTVSFDGGGGRYREGLRDLVQSSDLRILARDFALCYAGASSLPEAAKMLLADDPMLLVITDGARGSTLWTRGGESFHQPALPVARVMDTTGCGDVYHGAFLHGWLSGWSPERSAAFAADLAAETAAHLGGRSAVWKRFRGTETPL